MTGWDGLIGWDGLTGWYGGDRVRCVDRVCYCRW